MAAPDWSPPTRRNLPIILIRGFGGLGVEDEKRVAYQGFNDGTVYPQKRGENYVYEGLILRFLKSNYKYQDATNVVGYFASDVNVEPVFPARLQRPDHPLAQRFQALKTQGFFAGNRVVIDPGMALELLEAPGSPRCSLWVFRYYDLDDRRFSTYAEALVRLIDFIRALTAQKDAEPVKVNIIAHSMGGLIVREAIQRIYRDRSVRWEQAGADPATRPADADDCINKVVTLGTPHQGISFQVLKTWIGPAADDLKHFSHEFQSDTRQETGFAGLAERFPLERFLTVVGTNYRAYGVTPASWLNRLFSVSGESGTAYNRSDGLVKQAYAQVPGAPRTFVHKCHGGVDSLVTSPGGVRDRHPLLLRQRTGPTPAGGSQDRAGKGPLRQERVHVRGVHQAQAGGFRSLPPERRGGELLWSVPDRGPERSLGRVPLGRARPAGLGGIPRRALDPARPIPRGEGHGGAARSLRGRARSAGDRVLRQRNFPKAVLRPGGTPPRPRPVPPHQRGLRHPGGRRQAPWVEARGAQPDPGGQHPVRLADGPGGRRLGVRRGRHRLHRPAANRAGHGARGGRAGADELGPAGRPGIRAGRGVAAIVSVVAVAVPGRGRGRLSRRKRSLAVPIPVARFRPSGGPIRATVECGFANVGSYTLYLWEADVNQVVEKARGNLINADDDARDLPGPNAAHHRRLVECLATIIMTPPIRDYSLALIIGQDGVEIGRDAVIDSSDERFVPVDLFVQLEAG